MRVAVARCLDPVSVEEVNVFRFSGPDMLMRGRWLHFLMAQLIVSQCYIRCFRIRGFAGFDEMRSLFRMCRGVDNFACAAAFVASFSNLLFPSATMLDPESYTML